jgi:hypothetical protein
MARWIEIPREEYERRVLATLRKELLEGSSLVEREGRIKMEDVRLDTSDSPHQVHVLFREVARPACLFGFRTSVVEDEEESLVDPIVLDPEEGYWGPEEWAGTMIVTHFEEQVEALGLGLPPDCDPEGVTWVNGYRRLPPGRARWRRPEGSVAELDERYENWRLLTGELVCSLENTGWFTSVPYALTGSAEGGDDFRYHIIVYTTVLHAMKEGKEPVFELYDEARDVVAYVRTIPSPGRAPELLRAHGIPAEEGDRIRARLPEPPEQLLD